MFWPASLIYINVQRIRKTNLFICTTLSNTIHTIYIYPYIKYTRCVRMRQTLRWRENECVWDKARARDWVVYGSFYHVHAIFINGKSIARMPNNIACTIRLRINSQPNCELRCAQQRWSGFSTLPTENDFPLQ